MIIDIHAHVCAAPELYQWKAVQMSARGAHGFAPKRFADEWVRDHPDTKRNLRVMDAVGTDVQFISPRPFQLMHAEKPVGGDPLQTASLLAGGTSQYRCTTFDTCVGSCRVVQEQEPPTGASAVAWA